MYKIIVFVPSTHAQIVKDALFAAGAGKLGNYDCCCFETTGIGQFRPLPGSHPYLGEENLIETVEEIKIELVCDEQYLRESISALKQHHPYETPAYDIIKLINESFE